MWEEKAMKKFLLTILLFVCCVALLTMGINAVYIRQDCRDRYYTDRFRNIPDAVTVCNVGSSHGYYSFNYEELQERGEQCFNFAFSAQFPSYDLVMLQHFGEHLAPGCLVFIPLSDYLLFGGGLAMGSLMYTTGLSNWVGEGIRDVLGGHPSEWLFVGLFCVAALILSELTSHTAATNLLGPIAIGAAISVGFNPIPVAIGIALSSSLGFMMPVSTPPNAIVYSSGYVPLTKMIKSGVIIDIVGIFVITIPLVMLLVKLITK